MKILYAASEANPFAKSGGLADVAGALPKALVKDGVDARVIMPLYGDLKYRDKLEYVTNYSVPVGWRSQYCGLFKADVDGVTYYFLDNEYYFKRRGLYGFYDDGERFAFFSRAVLETLFYIDFTPDIINCNDWQTALVPVYLNLYYRHLDKFNRIKTVFTIHNIAYQGKYGTDILEDTCGIGHRDQHIVEYDANFMKGNDCRQITTVSPTYAQGDFGPVVAGLTAAETLNKIRHRHLDKFNRIKSSPSTIFWHRYSGGHLRYRPPGSAYRGVRRLRQLHEGRFRDRRQDHHRQPHLRTGDP